MAKQKGFVPCAIISTQLGEDEMLRLACTTLLEVHSFHPTKKIMVDFDEACPLSCAFALLRIFNLPVLNNQVFLIYNPRPACIDFIKLRDPDVLILLVDSGQKMNDLKIAVRHGITLRENSDLLRKFTIGANTLINSRPFKSRLPNKSLVQQFGDEIRSAHKKYDLLMDDFKANVKWMLFY